jgi:SAM-dependent methyltransferase
MNSKEYYNKIADDYSAMLLKRERYLKAIENEVCNSKDVKNYLDIGCGDGSRSIRIISELKPLKSILIDESDQMVNLFTVRKDLNIQLITGNFLNEEFKDTFDVIACLWNVLGHVETRELRLAFLKKIYNLLDESGTLYFDVNNRYNIRTYGKLNVISNIIKDFFKLKKTGYWRINPKKNVSSIVYIHNPFEMGKLLKEAGFMKFKKLYFDYNTGTKVNSFFAGQILYKVQKR